MSSHTVDKPLRVLVVNPDYYRSSGVTVALKRLHQAMSALPVEYVYISCLTDENTAGKPEEVDWMARPPLRLDLMSRNPLSLAHAIWFLAKLIISQNIQVVHVHHRRLAIICGWVARLLKRPTVYTGHLVYGSSRIFTFASISSAIAVTKSVHSELVSDFPNLECLVISNIVEGQPVSPIAQEKRINCIARLAPVKNHETLIRAWAEVECREDWRLVFHGEGEIKRDLEILANDLGVAKSIVFAGFTSDINFANANAAFCVLPSLIEGQGIVTLEAAAIGRPSLVADVPGSRDCIPAGLQLPNLFDPLDKNQLRDFLEGWMANPEAVEHDGIKMRNFVRQIASPNVVAARTFDVYRKVTS